MTAPHDLFRDFCLDCAAIGQRLGPLLDRVPAGTDGALRARILVSLGSAEARRGRLAEAEASYAEAADLLADGSIPAGRGLAWMDLLWPVEAHSGNERVRWHLVLSRAGLLAAEGRVRRACARRDA